MAGGYGTRISEESHLKPKPMIEIGGQPILWHIMKYYSAFGHNEFIICSGYKAYVIKEYFADYYLFRSDVTFDFAHGGEMTIHSNVSEPWRVTVVDTGLDTQTGGRVRRIEKFVEDEPFFLTYGDGVSNIDLDAILRQHENSDKTVTLSAIQPGGRFGVLDISADSETVTGFKEKAKEDGGWINAGFMVCEQGIFDYLDGDETILERAPMQRLSADGKLGVYRHDGYWQCMDTQRDKDRLNAAWRSGKAPWKVW